MQLMLVLVACLCSSAMAINGGRKSGKPDTSTAEFTLCDHPYRQSMDYRMLPMISTLNANLCPVARELSDEKPPRGVKLNCTAKMRRDQLPWWKQPSSPSRPIITLAVNTRPGHKLNIYL